MASPEISVSPSAVDFGEIVVGETSTVSVKVTNTGTVDLELTAISMSDGDAPPKNDFDVPLLSGGIPPAFPVVIAPGNAVTFSAVYTPGELESDADRIRISTNDPVSPIVEVTLAGTGVAPTAPEITVTPDELLFNTVFVGSGRSRRLIVTNDGTAALAISSLAVTGSGRSAYSLRDAPDSFPYEIQPAQSLELTVIYRPTQVRSHFAELVIASNDADEGAVSVSLSGRGIPEALPEITVAPTAVDFGHVFLASPSSTRVTISNTGLGRLEVLGLRLTAETHPDFRISGFDQPISLPFGASVETRITYVPSEQSTVFGALEVLSNDDDEPVVTITLTGAGVPEPVPQIDVAPAALDFMETFIDTSTPMSVSITNTGTATLEITSIALSLDTSPEYQVTGFDQAISLAPGANVTTKITYSPVDLGVDVGTLAIESNDAETPRSTVALSGTGVPATTPQIQVIAPPVLDFGTVFVGATDTLPVIINNIGTAPLEVSAIELGPDSSLDFEITGFAETISLVPGAGITTRITYTPDAEGTDSGTLMISSSDADQPMVTVSIAGRGVPVPVARIHVTPKSLDFGDVFVDSPSRRQLEIKNTGTALLDISSIRLSDDTSEEFVVTGFDQQIILVPQASVTTEVTYTPVDNGADSGTLVIESDDSEMSTAVVSLAGVGVPEPRPRIDVTPSQLDYDQVQIGAMSTQFVTIGNSGTEPLEITFIGLGAYTLGEFLVTGGPETAIVLPGEEVLVDVTYSPLDEGADSGTLRIDSNDPDAGAVSVSLTGSGVPAPVPQIVVEPASLLFGDVFIGQQRALTVTILNSGTAPLQILDVALGLSNSSDFAITGGETSATVPPDEETSVEVTYTPSDEASDSGTLRIQSNDAEEPLVTVSLFGTGLIDPDIPPIFSRGDANADGNIDVGDPIKTIGSLFRNEPAPLCFDAADANDDGSLNLTDAIFTLTHLFGDGVASPPPGFYTCGPDPTEDDLPRCSYPADLCDESNDS